MARQRNRSIPNVIRNNVVRSSRVVRPAIDYRNGVPVISYRRIRSPIPLRLPVRQMYSAPGRVNRYVTKKVLQSMVSPRVYSSLHNCKKEWSKLLSWRSSQGSGRKRSRVELRNSKNSFNRKDC